MSGANCAYLNILTPKKMAKQKFTADEVSEAIVNAKGILATAAQSLGCSRGTVSNYIERYSTVKAAFEEANETNIDNVESKLMAAIDGGDTTAIIFFLKTKAKQRGYVERQEVTGKDGSDLTVRIEYADADIDPDAA
jgi:hypothetical protein